MKLKHDSSNPTDVTVMRAEDLKRVAEAWPKLSDAGKFPLQVCNMTGILGRATLEE